MSNLSLIIFFLFITIFYIYMTYSNNPYTLTLIFGKKGAGKTSYIAKMSQKYIKKGYKVYTNCNVKGTYNYDPKDIGIYTFEPGSVIFCDEVGIVWNNREYKTFKRCIMEWFKYQRQYKLKMYLFSQIYDDSDKSIRNVTDHLYLIKRYGRFSILRPIIKNIGIGTDSNGNGQIVDSYKFGSVLGWKFIWLSRYYGFFKSFNPPELPLIKSTFEDYDDLADIYKSFKMWVLFTFKSKSKFIYEKINSLFNKD